MNGIWVAVKATTSLPGSSRYTTLKLWKSRPAAPMMSTRFDIASPPDLIGPRPGRPPSLRATADPVKGMGEGERAAVRGGTEVEAPGRPGAPQCPHAAR